MAHPVIQSEIAQTIKSKKAGTKPKIRNRRAQKIKVVRFKFKFFGRFDPTLKAFQ